MTDKESVVLTRDVDIVTIPDGTTGMLRQGMMVTVHQALGDSFTVITDYGHMVRIAGGDADALGRQPQRLQTLVSEDSAEAIEQNCWEVMRTVYDPEIPVNIVELGLVYYCKVTPMTDGHYAVEVIMTLTAPGCGMGPVIQGDVERGIRALPGVGSVNVEVVLDPPWSRDMMSEVAKLQLGLY
ncbi:putative Fe-S cluster assembly protein SufT [Methylovulum psychrotolerans]|jgi:probable FeS assembly SUF system protein SufT|uniref:Putative Fe-S cluster assembly protein SufT n=1 Tax=Methylovulum psychrotolerans TaxID=1704499 RepID=A0A1Z4BYR9_9GAMM|nr:putative Fe-S cluster assembly protein SufT [Methylovulum psychrotolerans]ASF46425.1 putative Fe-S cluster assembly protein SufT [Methylovulum psychrotolerans]MBT9098084.1 putative Fe-S cluster assembly protein SufT [Methylovulum psychrotolerans]POZ53782.1 putative Fe-S cluster assembly protein SufT [Methylovulum psychrotolerans]